MTTNFAAAVNGSLVTFTWAAAGGCAATSYTLQAGSAPGLTNLAILNVATRSASRPWRQTARFIFVLSHKTHSGSGPSNEVVVTIGSAPPPPSPGSFSPGQHRVNIDIPPGRCDPAPGCYFERQNGLGGTFGEIIANQFIAFDASQWIIDIRGSDVGFETDPECGRWYTTPRHGFQATIPQGMWLVGSQVAPGTYGTFALSGCYWERLRHFDGTFSGIIDNECLSGASPQFVTIVASEAGFRTDDDCGVWSR